MPQKIAWRTIAGIGAKPTIAIPRMSVMMPTTLGAIITLIVISAAFVRSPTSAYTS